MFQLLNVSSVPMLVLYKMESYCTELNRRQRILKFTLYTFILLFSGGMTF